MGILPAETEIEFLQDENGRWYIINPILKEKCQPFRTAHKAGNLTMSTDRHHGIDAGLNMAVILIDSCIVTDLVDPESDWFDERFNAGATGPK